MVIKTFRDAEIQIGKLLTEIRGISRNSQTIDTSDFVSKSELTSALSSAIKPTQNLVADSDLTADGNTITHNFIHRFLNDTTVDGFLVANPLITKNGTKSWSFYTDASTGELFIQDESGNEILRIENPVNGASFPVDCEFDMHLLPVVSGTNDIGSALLELRRIYSQKADFSSDVKHQLAGATYGTTIRPTSGGGYYILNGATYDGTNFTATATNASILFLNNTGLNFYFNTALVVGNTFTPTLTFTAAATVTASRPAKFNASKVLISALIDLTSADDVTGVLPLANGGTNSNAWTADRPVRVNAAGTALEPVPLVKHGTVYVAASSGGAVTTALTFTNGIATS